MKSFSRILSLLICFELLVGPWVPQLGTIHINISIAETPCPNSSMQFDSRLGRCIVPHQAATIRNAVNSCNQGSQADRSKCYRRNAETALGEEFVEQVGKFSGDGLGVVKKGMNAAAVAIPLYIASRWFWGMRQTNGIKCRSASMYAFLGGAVALAAGEYVFDHFYKKEIEKLSTELEEVVSTRSVSETDADRQRRNSTEAQGRTFEIMAEKERAMQRNANWKIGLFAAATASFGAAAFIANTERVALNRARIAMNSAPPEQKVALTARYNQLHASTHCITNNGQGPVAEGGAEATSASSAEVSASTGVAEGTQDAASTGAAEGTEDAASETAPAGTTRRTCVGIACERGESIYQYQNLPRPRSLLPGGGGSETLFPRYHDQLDIPQFSYSQIIDRASNFAAFNLLLQHKTNSASSPSIEDYEFFQMLYQVPTLNEEYSIMSSISDLKIRTGEINVLISEKVRNVSRILMNNAIAETLPYIPPPRLTESIVPIAARPIGVVPPVSPQELMNAIRVPGPQVNSISSGFSRMIRSPATRAVLGATFAGWSAFMTGHAIKQSGDSAERAKQILAIRDTFVDTTNAIDMCTSEDRLNPGKPECYCYTPDNRINTARQSSSEVCQRYLSARRDLTPGTYLVSPEQPRACVTSNGSIDSDCSCRSNNSCNRISIPNLSGFNPGSFSLANQATQPIAEYGAGNFEAGNVGAFGNANLAARVLAENKKLLSSNELKKDQPALESVAQDIKNTLSSLRTSGSGPVLGSNSSTPLSNLSPSQVLSELEKELKSSKSGNSNNDGGGSIPVQGIANEQLEFGLTNDQFAAQQGQVAEVMDKNLDYGQNDISSGGASIFEVLSNRYQRSAMRRLFDGEDKVEADKSSNSDINK